MPFAPNMIATESKEGDQVKYTIFICIAAAALAGCGRNEGAASAAPTSKPVPQVAPTPGAAPTAAPQASAINEAGLAPAASVSGTVLETMDAAGYTYLKLKTSSGEIWAAVPQTKTQVGANVALVGTMQIDKFESKTLKRTFDHIVFGQIGQPGQPAPAMASAAGTPPTAGNPNPHTGMMGAANAPKVDLNSIKVEKASGANAKTVAELWAAKDVRDAPVTVRGKVVKFLPGIMGKNWMHLRDGSGTQLKVDNDLTVTTNDTVAIGDVVTIKGTVRRDKDFGAGYSYGCIVEDASVSK